MRFSEHWQVALKGCIMGMAEVVPGVSGGTIAFITGIYTRLIAAIKRVSRLPVAMIFQQGFGVFWRHIDGNFLLLLGAGMLAGIAAGVLGISFFLERYPPIVWGFFFGLITASIFVVGRVVSPWNISQAFFFVGGAAVAYLLTQLTPGIQQHAGFLTLFLAGALAVCALILPGVSGSFILLLLGLYTVVIGLAREVLTSGSSGALLRLVVFALGCLVGLLLFSNALHWLLQRHYRSTMAVLTGFLAGSLGRLWPWRNPVLWVDKNSGRISHVVDGDLLARWSVLSETNVGAAQYHGDPWTPYVVLAAGVAMTLVVLFGQTQKHMPVQTL